MSERKGALSGIRVLDLTRVLAGPFAAQLLGDLGAEVVKVERPGTGDDGRFYGFYAVKDKDGNKTKESSFFLCANRNKKSVTVDLAKPEGQAIVRALAQKADVLIENYKVGDLARHGLDEATLRALNPRLVYCSITGFGQTGPYRARAGYDSIFQGMGGLMAITGIPDGQPGAGPMKVGPSLVDVFTGHNAAIAILAALNHRHNSGRGQYIDMALLDVSIAIVSQMTQDLLTGGIAPPRPGNGGSGGGPGGLVECKDGQVYISPGFAQWPPLCDLIGQPDLATNPRYDTIQKRGGPTENVELLEIISQWSRRYSVTEVFKMLDDIGVSVARFNELEDVFEDEQVKHRGLKVSVPLKSAASGRVDLIGSPLAHMSESPADPTACPPPLLGEHTDAVLSEMLGLSLGRIAELRAAGIV
jgi:crotonobetainyl-CoA:carnitine CoA-transferase CaiB-like acyl-CoA transferase